MEMNLRIETNGDTVVVRIHGSLYVNDAAALRMELLNYIQKGQKHFIIDLTQTDYIDSSGLGVLVGIHKRAMEHKGSVRIRGLQGVVRELFELTRLTQVFEIL